MGFGRVFDGIDDWLEVQFSLPPFGGNVVDSFSVGGWLQTSDSAGVDRGLYTAHDDSAATSFGLYWNKDELLVKYAHRPTGSPGGSGTNEEKSVSYTTAMGVPVFVAVTATMDSPGSSAAIPTFRFYAGTTVAGIVLIGSPLAATSSIKASSRNFAIGAATTGSGTQTATAGTFFAGILERWGLFHFESYTLDQLKDYASRGVPHTITAFADFGDVGGQSFEMWDVLPTSGGDEVEKDVGINFFTAEFRGGMVEGDVTASILPDPQSYSVLNGSDLGTGTRVSELQVLDSGRVLGAVQKSAVGSAPAEMWGSDDDGATWSLLHTFPSSPNAATIDQIVDLGSGVVIATGQVTSAAPKIWKSTDYGDTWTEKAQPSVSTIHSLIDMGSGRLLAGTGTGGKVFESTDSGDTWAELATISGINTVRSFVNLGGGTILAGGNANDVYHSTDDGASWSAYATMSGGTTGRVQMRQLVSGRIIATTHQGNVYVSDDEGAGWTRTLDNGDFISLYDNNPHSVILGPIGSKYFIRSEVHGYLFETEDEGSTFEKYHYNTQGPTTQDAAVQIGDKILLAGNDWLCSPALRISAFDVVPPVEEENPCICPPEVEVPQEERTIPYTEPKVEIPVETRTIPYTEDTPPPIGSVIVTEVVKLLEYHLPSGSLGTCSLRVRIRILRVSDLVQVFELDQYTLLTYNKRWTDLDDFALRLSADAPQGIRMRQLGIVPTNGQFIVNVVIDGLSDFSGIIDQAHIHITNRGEHLWRLTGNGCDRILADRVILPPSGLVSDSYTGAAETVMKSLVDRHLANPLTSGIANVNDADRKVNQLLIAPDAGLGNIIEFTGRFQKVHEGLVQISKSSNDMGFSVTVAKTNLIFEVSEGVDRSASCVLAVELDNMADFQYDKDGTQFASHAIMAGVGEADQRLVTATSTPTSLRTNIERREIFQDSRDLLTLDALTDKGKALLQDKGAVDTFGGLILLGSHPCYRRDYQVGDFITIKSFTYGLSQVVRVMEAKVTIEGGQLESCDLTFAKPSKRFIQTLRALPPITATARN